MGEHPARITTLLEDLPLRPTIGAALIIGLLLPATLVAWFEVNERRETLFENLTNDHERIVETLAIGMQTPIWDVRPDTGKPLVDVIMADERVTAVSVTAPVLPRFLDAAKPQAGSDDNGVALERPVVRAGRQIGTVRVAMTTTPLKSEAARQGRQALLTTFFQMALGLLLVFPLIRFKVLAPLRRLVEQSRELAAGQLDQPLDWRRGDELGSLGRSFEDTRRSLQGLFRDLEQRNVELELRENTLSQQTRVLRATLDNMTDGISLIDGELRLLAWNDRFVELFKFPPDLIREGVPMTEIHRFDVERGQLTPAAAKSLGEEMLRMPKGQSFTAQTKTADGKVILLRRRPLAGGGYVTTYTDETERVKALDKAEETLHLLKAVMDAVPAILHVKDQDLRYRFVNRYFLDLFGLQREQVIDRKLTEVLRPEQLTEFRDLGPEVLASGKPISLYEMAIRRADGERIDMLGSKVPLLDGDGAVTHVVTFEIDITERKRIQQALSDSEELYRLLVNQSPYGILLHDEQAIVFINPAGCQMLGASETEQIVGRHYGEFVAQSDRRSGMARLTRILDPGVSVGQTERRLVTLDGREIIVATSGVPFTQGTKRLALVIFVDISELKQAESEIARQREALHQAEKISALGSLLAGVAHELNNPLSVVIGRSIMLSEKQLDPRVAAGIEKIRAAAERCAGIVKSFLAMARQQAQARVPVRVDVLMDSSLDFLAYGLDSAGIRVIKQYPPNLPGTLADPDQLSQVFNNLITNSQQALVEWSGPRELRIAADVDRRRREIRITVSDTGPGIPEDVQSRVFDPFFTTKPMGAGTGIGLALCHGILEAHGGTIAVGKSSSGGASFIVTLPIVEAENGLAGTGVSDRAEKSRPVSILVVDDEEEIRSMLGDILTADGHRVEEASDGRQALARLAESPYDLVISDLIMPGLDGPGLYAALRTQFPSMAGRIVFITGDTLSPTAQEFLKHAGRPVIEKPFMPEEVRRTVRDCLM